MNGLLSVLLRIVIMVDQPVIPFSAHNDIGIPKGLQLVEHVFEAKPADVYTLFCIG
jgi:hypothetical protein